MGGAQVVLCVLNFIEALVFGLFVIIMFFDQLSAIFENSDGYDSGSELDKTQKPTITRYQALQQVFGEKFNFKWFLPLNLNDQVVKDFLFELEEEERVPILENPKPIQPPKEKVAAD